MSHIFISYSRRDLDLAQKIVDALGQKEVETWVDWKSIPKGEDWEIELDPLPPLNPIRLRNEPYCAFDSMTPSKRIVSARNRTCLALRQWRIFSSQSSSLRAV